jgi:homoserine kinase
MPQTEIIVPASTSNLGSSFDTCGLALALYLRVTVEAEARGFEVVPTGEGAGDVPRDASNLIVRTARFVAEQRGVELGGARLRVHSEIPLARGLGSSSSAIIAGISVYEALTGDRLGDDEFFRYALHYEDHGDNLAPCRLGGLVLACIVEEGHEQLSMIAVKRAWPEEVKVVIAIPELEMETVKMRAALPKSVPLRDAIFNMQRAALLQAAIAERKFELIGEALRDRLHQPFRAPLAPGLSEVLYLNNELHRFPGLLGVAISGAGSTMIAFATENCEKIAGAMQSRFEACGVRARAMEVKVDNAGRVLEG